MSRLSRCGRWIAILLLLLCSLAAIADDLESIPLGKGLPVVVKTGVFYNSIESFDDNGGQFRATTDLRLRWVDPRLRYPVEEGLRGYKEYRGRAADRQIERIWTPRIVHPNRIGEAEGSERRLRLYPDGTVEIIERATADYRVAVDVARFPFDHQRLRVEVEVDEDATDRVDLDYSHEDVAFSRAAIGSALDGWQLGLVDLQRAPVRGWNGEHYGHVYAELDVQRVAGRTVPTIFIPLFASLLIPFLATWMNRAEGDGFAVDAFELANVVIGGLFAVIALGFAISSSFPLIGASDNTVTRLIGLNYVALAVGLIITVVFYRYRLPGRWFGAHVQVQTFEFLTWAFPFTFIATGLAMVAAAAM